MTTRLRVKGLGLRIEDCECLYVMSNVNTKLYTLETIMKHHRPRHRFLPEPSHILALLTSSNDLEVRWEPE